MDPKYVMAGLVPAIYVLLGGTKVVDARHKAGHDGGETGANQLENDLAIKQSGSAIPALVVRRQGRKRGRMPPFSTPPVALGLGASGWL